MTIAAQTGPARHGEPRPAYKSPRMPRDEFFIEVAKLYSLRSTCVRGQVGCIAVRDKRQIAAGYNGAPAGMDHCLDVGCGGGVLKPGQLDPLVGGEMPRPAEMQDRWEFPNGCTRSIHAEMNMVAYAARLGVSLEGSTVYATAGPCLPCAQVYVASGIACLHFLYPYRLPEGLQLVDKAAIKIVQHES